MRYAITDIGSNTVKINIFELEPPTIEKIASKVCHLKLIDKIEKGILSHDGISDLCETLITFKEFAKEYKADAFYAFATASLRRAENSAEIIEAVKKTTDITIDLISGEDEAKFSLAGVRRELLTRTSGLLLDMGGGSTEVISFSDDKASFYSMPFGSLSLYKDFVTQTFPNEQQSSAIREYVKKEFLKAPKAPYDLIVAGGTGHAISTLLGKTELPSCAGYDELTYLYKELTDNPEIIRDKVPNRLTTVIPGLTAILKIAEENRSQNVIFVSSGVREGYLLSLISKEK